MGHFGDRDDDVVFLGKCDDVVRELARELGWEDELQEAWEATADAIEDTSTKKAESELDKLTDDVKKALAISSDESKPAEKETVTKGEEPLLQIPEGKPAQHTKSSSGISEQNSSSEESKPQSPADGKL